jgi:hypothetical protein
MDLESKGSVIYRRIDATTNNASNTTNLRANNFPRGEEREEAAGS